MKILKTAIAIKEKIIKHTMLGMRMYAYGGPEVLRYEEVPRPKAGPGEVLVQVHAAGVNPVDWKVREGYLKQIIDFKLPLIPGWDCSGVVDSCGPGATRFEVGDEVFGRAEVVRNGTYAEYVVMKESELAFKPKLISHIEAAAIPLASLTAWQSLFDAAQLKEGQTVLIHAAAGGVGHFAVQLARWKGAYVIGTASKNNREFLRQLGADEAIDYEAMRFEDIIHNADVVFDTIGGDTQRRSWKALKKGGILVSIVSPPFQQEADAHSVRQAFVRVHSDEIQLAEIAELVDSGELRPVIETVLPLSEARQAQELSRKGHTRGKIVLRIV